MSRRPGLFDPCPCGSGRRFHSCCRALGDGAPDPAKLVQLALRRHAARDLAAAEDLYRRALALDAAHSDGLRNLSVLLAERGAFDEAETLLRRLLELEPDSPHAYFALGTVLARQKRLEAAAEAYRTASELDPALVHAFVNLGAVLAELGRPAPAMEALERAVALDPRNPDAAINLALLKSDAGHHGAALELAARAARAGGVDPRYRTVQGMLALRAGAREEALAAYRAVLEQRPEDFDARVNVGSCLADLGQPREAIGHFEQALRLQPQSAQLWCNLALAHVESGALEPAREAVAQAVRLEPADPMVRGHQGLIAALSGGLEEALGHYRGALEREPGNISYCIGVASVLYESGEPERAAQAYRDFLERYPASTSAHFELSTALLQLGRFAEAWPHFDYRNQTRFRRVRGERLPPLEALRGRRLVLRFEQGLGDHFFFLRFVPALRAVAQPAEVVFLSRPEILPLAQRVAGLDSVVLSKGPDDEPGLLLGDLPGYVMTRGDEPAPPPAPIAALGEARERARALLSQAGHGPYLAVTWEAGSPPALEREQRLAMLKLHKRIDPRRLGAALAPWSGTVLSLQRLPRERDAAAFEAGLGRKAVDLSALNQDLETMLALLEVVDEYVGVSNTNMHLRAAAGRASRVLVPRPYEWRWMYAGSESPWFPGCRVYREERGQDWRPALDTLQRDLARPDAG
jgi:tetratricopeptide (TPR) repeat protein